MFWFKLPWNMFPMVSTDSKPALIQMIVLAPNKLHTIIWNKHWQIYWHMYASFGLNELRYAHVFFIISLLLTDRTVELPGIGIAMTFACRRFSGPYGPHICHRGHKAFTYCVPDAVSFADCKVMQQRDHRYPKILSGHASSFWARFDCVQTKQPVATYFHYRQT